MFKFVSVLKIIIIAISVTLLVAFGIGNMHTTELHFPFAAAVEINVVFLFIVGLLLGAGSVFAVVTLGRFKKKG